MEMSPKTRGLLTQSRYLPFSAHQTLAQPCLKFTQTKDERARTQETEGGFSDLAPF